MKSCLFSIKLLLLLICSFLTACAVTPKAPVAITGEQLDHAVPKGWKLAWKAAAPDGQYLVEYIPETDDIHAWRDGYLGIVRTPYPPDSALHETEAEKIAYAKFVLAGYIESAAAACQGRHDPMPQKTYTINHVVFAIGGGFCEKFGTDAPLGEGAMVAFVPGKDYLFRIQYDWRPKSTRDGKKYLPWRIAPQVAKEYLNAIKASSLCAGAGQPACQNSGESLLAQDRALPQ